ncbi:MAG TPA: tetratricopeptide repeat protein, partial [Stellaceae bacterium]|nr:tetratricopeptide repeat protein [Stellaceae bacterium]
MANHPQIDNPPQALLAAALNCARNGDTDKALGIFARVFEHDPHFAEAYNELAILLLTTGRLATAIAAVRRATLVKPNDAKYWSNLGIMLGRVSKFEEGLAALRRAAALDPQRPETFHNLGTLYHQIGDYPTAIANYDRSLMLRPDNVDVLFDRSVSLLASGDLGNGFAAYETRLLRKDVGSDFVKSIPIPIWNGEDLRGKTIIVYGEQGFGDTIQFARLLPTIAERGARVIFYCR